MVSIGILFSRTYIGSSDFSYAAAPVKLRQNKTRSVIMSKLEPLMPFTMTYATRSPKAGADPAKDVSASYSECVNKRTSITLLHPFCQLYMSLLCCIVYNPISQRMFLQKIQAHIPALANALVMTSCDMSTLFCRRSEMTCLV